MKLCYQHGTFGKCCDIIKEILNYVVWVVFMASSALSDKAKIEIVPAESLLAENNTEEILGKKAKIEQNVNI